MSKRERDRLAIVAGVERKELTLVQASDLLDLSYRQTKRVWRRYQEEGDAGLVHRLRGQPSLRRKPDAVRAAVLELYEQKDYADFGPTLLAEHLARRKIEVTPKRCAGGCWPKASGRCAAADSSTGNGGSAKPASARWCRWTARITTGWRADAPSAC